MDMKEVCQEHHMFFLWLLSSNFPPIHCVFTYFEFGTKLFLPEVSLFSKRF